MKGKKFLLILILLLIVVVGTVYYLSLDKFEDFGKLHKKLPEKNIATKAQITKINEVRGYSIKLGDSSYTNGWLYTYIFDANSKKYMGNYFTKVNKFEINDSIPIIYMPDNPKINEYKR